MDCKSLRLWCTNCSGKNGSESKTENFQVLVHAARKWDKNKPREGLPWLFSVSLSLILSVWHSVHCAPTEDVPPTPCIQIWLKTVTAVRGTRCWWGWACTNRADTVPAKPPAESWGDAGSHCSYHLLEMGVSGDAGNQFELFASTFLQQVPVTLQCMSISLFNPDQHHGPISQLPLTWGWDRTSACEGCKHFLIWACLAIARWSRISNVCGAKATITLHSLLSPPLQLFFWSVLLAVTLLNPPPHNPSHQYPPFFPSPWSLLH